MKFSQVLLQTLSAISPEILVKNSIGCR